tara:strand:+ start:940 stop:1470 length:531 start_codon:yes stop_codon:yes gene_type:complete
MWGEDNAWMNRLGDDMDRREKSERRDRHADAADRLARGWKRVPVPKAEVEAQYADAMEDWSLSRAEAGPMSGVFASMDYPQPQRSEFMFKWVPPKGRAAKRKARVSEFYDQASNRTAVVHRTADGYRIVFGTGHPADFKIKGESRTKFAHRAQKLSVGWVYSKIDPRKARKDKVRT